MTKASATTKPHPGKGTTLPPLERAKRAPKRPAKIRALTDWRSVRDVFVTGNFPASISPPAGMITRPSISQVALAFGLHPKTVFKKSAAEGWVEERERFQVELAGRVRQQTLEQLTAAHLEARAEGLFTARQWIQYSQCLAKAALSLDGTPVLEPKDALAGVSLLQKALETIELISDKNQVQGSVDRGVEDWLAMRVARVGPTIDAKAVSDRSSQKM